MDKTKQYGYYGLGEALRYLNDTLLYKTKAFNEDDCQLFNTTFSNVSYLMELLSNHNQRCNNDNFEETFGVTAEIFKSDVDSFNDTAKTLYDKYVL